MNSVLAAFFGVRDFHLIGFIATYELKNLKLILNQLWKPKKLLKRLFTPMLKAGAKSEKAQRTSEKNQRINEPSIKRRINRFRVRTFASVSNTMLIQSHRMLVWGFLGVGERSVKVAVSEPSYGDKYVRRSGKLWPSPVGTAIRLSRFGCSGNLGSFTRNKGTCFPY